jgi:hypothetical protein
MLPARRGQLTPTIHVGHRAFLPVDLALLLLAVTLSFRTVAADDNARSIVDSAQNYERSIISGRVVLDKVTQRGHLSERALAAIVEDPRQVEVERQIQKTLPPRVHERARLLFDNQRNKLLEQGNRDGQIRDFRLLFTQALSEDYSNAPIRGSTYEEVQVRRPIWPPYWPYNLWRGRLWAGRAIGVSRGELLPRLLGNDPQTGSVILLLVGGPGSELDQKLWVDVRRGYTIGRIQFLDKAGHIQEECATSYQPYGKDLWYPSQIVDSYYSYDRQGRDYLARTEVTLAREVRLNLALTDRDFEFGDIPRGALVQDNRFRPPLVYRQGNRQFTERELFQMSKDRNLLSDPRWFENPPSPVAYLLAGLGALLLTGSILFARKARTRR